MLPCKSIYKGNVLGVVMMTSGHLNTGRLKRFVFRLLNNRCVLTINICLLACFASALAADWPQWRGLRRDGISEEIGWRVDWPEEGPKVLWQGSVGSGFSAISISAGRAFTMGSDGKLDTVYCLNATTGEEIWHYRYPCKTYSGFAPEGGPASTPVVADGAVYTLSREGEVFCFTAKNGEMRWHRNLKNELHIAEAQHWHGFTTSPLVEGRVLILDVGPTVGLDKETGDILWHTENQIPSYASPVSFTLNTKRYVAAWNGQNLLILNPLTGKEKARLEWFGGGNQNMATPIIKDDLIFLSSGTGKGCSLLRFDDGKITPVWENMNMRNLLATSVLWDGQVYGFDDVELRCIDFKTGKLQWKKAGLGKGSLIIADAKLMILSDKGELVIAKATPEKFETIAATQALGGHCWTIPVLANGLLYCRNAAGKIVCLDLRKPEK